MPHVSFDVDFNSALVRNVRSTSYNDSAQVAIVRASGSPDPGNLFLNATEPIVSLQSSDIGGLAALNAGTFLSGGMCITGATTTIPVAKRADCGILASGASHTAFVGNDVVVIPTQLEVRQDSEEGATCNFEARFRSSDGITAPFTVSTTTTLSAATVATTYGLGRAYVDGSELTYLTGITVNPGITLLVQRVGGGIFPMYHYIETRTPTIDFMVENAEAAASFALRYGSGNVAVRGFFRARSDGSVYVADATAAHVRFSFATAMSRMETLEASQTGNGSVTLRCHGKTLVVATGVAIA